MAVRRKPMGMTVADFLAWEPEEHPELRWQLFDGEPVCMAPTSEDHGAIQAEANSLLGLHLRVRRPSCAVVLVPSVAPRVSAANNLRIADLGVTCSPPSGGQFITDPVLLAEVVSPSNQRLAWENVWTYATIPSVAEILLLGGVRVEAELWRRGQDGSWPGQPLLLGEEDGLELASIGFRAALRDFYRTTSLYARR